MPQSLTMLDMGIILIIVLSTYLGYRKGFVHTLFNLASLVVSLFLVNLFYPVLSRFLMTTSLFYNLRDYIIDMAGISHSIEEITSAQQAQIINDLPLPNFLTTMINENNNLEIHNFLNVTRIEEYIAGFLAVIIINIISLIIVFSIVSMGLWLLSSSLHLIVKLPVIQGFNKSLGAVLGAVRSILFIWIALIAYTLLFIRAETNSVYILQNSTLALFFYERNFLLSLIIDMLAWYIFNIIVIIHTYKFFIMHFFIIICISIIYKKRNKKTTFVTFISIKNCNTQK